MNMDPLNWLFHRDFQVNGDKKEMSKRKSLYDWCLENNKQFLLEEWNDGANLPFTPSTVTYGSNIKRSWKCAKGHIWMDTVYHRIYGRGCPYCSNHKIQKGYNDLATTNPDLCKEWDYEANSPLSPFEVTAGSGKRVAWKCSKGHTWITTIHMRVSRGTNCPYCAGKKVIQGKNDLETCFPLLAREWDYDFNAPLTPSGVMAKSKKKVGWKCAKGHTWIAMIQDRVRGKGCPFCCSSKSSLPEYAIYYYLKKKFIAEWRYKLFGWEIDIYLPEFSIGIEHDGRAWHKGKDAETREQRKDIDCAKNGLRLIRIKESNKNEIDKDTIHYIFSTQYVHLDFAISSLFVILSRDLLISCDDISVDFARDRNIIESEYKKQILNPINSVDSNKLIKSEWDYDANYPLLPEQFSLGSNRKVFWKCDKGHSWQEEIVVRSHSAYKCPYCSGIRIVEGENDFVTWCNRNNRKDLLQEWDYSRNDPLLPSQIKAGSGKLIYWECSRGHSWKCTINHRIVGQNCPYCSNRRIIAGENDLATLNPKLAEEWDYEENSPLKPCDVALNYNRKVTWRCKKGHTWKASPNSRFANNSGCPFCNGGVPVPVRKVETGEIYESIARAQRECKINNISAVLTGKQKTAGGFHWEYYIK